MWPGGTIKAWPQAQQWRKTPSAVRPQANNRRQRPQFLCSIVRRNIMYSIEYIYGHCKILFMHCQKLGQNMISSPIFLYQLQINQSSHVIFGRLNFNIYWIVMTYRSFQHFWSAKMFIFYIFENVLNRLHFLRNSYVESVPENTKTKGKSVKSFNSNIKVISEVCHI